MTLPALEQALLAGTCAGLMGVVLLLWARMRGRHGQQHLQTTSPAVLRGLRLATGHAYRRRQPFAWTAPGDGTSSGVDPIHVNPETRALRLHIQALETALEEQHAEYERVRKELAVELDDARRHDGARALTTVMALRSRLTGEPGDIAVARVEAALARLTAPSAFTRPPLVRCATAAAAPPLAEPATHPLMTAVSTGGGVEQAAREGADSTTVHPPSVVLPVPVRAAHAVTTTPRRARWRRRSAS